MKKLIIRTVLSLAYIIISFAFFAALGLWANIIYRIFMHGWNLL